MKTRKIGKTELEVTEMSFGAAARGGLYRACPRRTGNGNAGKLLGRAASAIST